MVKSILLTLLYLGLFNFLLYRFKGLRFKNFKPVITYLLFNLKFLTGIFIWFIYTFYYKDVQNNDVHKFYTDAVVLHEAATESPGVFWDIFTNTEGNKGQKEEYKQYTSRLKNWDRNFDESPFNENRTIIRLNTLLLFVSFKTYFVHILFMCFISLLGWVLLTNAVFHFAPPRNAILALPVLFLPSILFWTSGVMKEPLLVLGLGLFINGLLISDRGFRIADLMKVLLGAFIILFTKFFVLACLLPAAIAYLLFKKNESGMFILVKYVAVSVVLALIAFSIQYAAPKINAVQMLTNKQHHAIKEAVYFKAGSRIEIPEMDGTVLSVVKVAPVGLWNALNRPYFWEAKNVMMLANSLELLFIIPFVVFCIAYTDWRQVKNLNLVLFLLTGALTYFAVVGMCTPVLGNMVRYKAPLLPVYLFAFVLLTPLRAIAPNFDFLLVEPSKVP